jgi:hypothetical protein
MPEMSIKAQLHREAIGSPNFRQGFTAVREGSRAATGCVRGLNARKPGIAQEPHRANRHHRLVLRHPEKSSVLSKDLLAEISRESSSLRAAIKSTFQYSFNMLYDDAPLYQRMHSHASALRSLGELLGQMSVVKKIIEITISF